MIAIDADLGRHYQSSSSRLEDPSVHQFLIAKAKVGSAMQGTSQRFPLTHGDIQDGVVDSSCQLPSNTLNSS